MRLICWKSPTINAQLKIGEDEMSSQATKEEICPHCGEKTAMVWEKGAKGCTRVQRCLSCRAKKRRKKEIEPLYCQGWTEATEEIVAFLENKAVVNDKMREPENYADLIAAKFLIWR